MIETTVLDFKLSNTFDEYRAWMNAPEQQAMFAEMGVKTFYIGVCKDDPRRATVMFQVPENVLYEFSIHGFLHRLQKNAYKSSSPVRIDISKLKDWCHGIYHFSLTRSFEKKS